MHCKQIVLSFHSMLFENWYSPFKMVRTDQIVTSRLPMTSRLYGSFSWNCISNVLRLPTMQFHLAEFLCEWSCFHYVSKLFGPKYWAKDVCEHEILQNICCVPDVPIKKGNDKINGLKWSYYRFPKSFKLLIDLFWCMMTHKNGRQISRVNSKGWTSILLYSSSLFMLSSKSKT
jgi:hypothetical protein